jgi:signal transduction histidine kinase
MLHKVPKLFIAYRAALLRCVHSAAPHDVSAAEKLGISALKNGLETLDLARLHEETLLNVLAIKSDRSNAEMIRLAGTFFTEAIMPIEGSHRAAREKNVQIQAAMDELNQRSRELVAKNKELKMEIQQRVIAEVALKTSELTTRKLLKEALHFQQELRSLSRNHFHMQEEERKVISRELHDVVAQTLTGINIRLTALALQTHANASEIQKNIAITLRHVEQSVDVVHRFARDLRPSVLDDLGLIPALNAYLKDFTERSGISGSISAFPSVETINDEEKTVLYRVAQEALVNIVRHSKATHATLTIRKLKNVVTMKIRDDGKGFTVNDPKNSQSKARLGLLGMRERVEMIGGSFLVTSVLGKGTLIQVKLDANIPQCGKKPAITAETTHP